MRPEGKPFRWNMASAHLMRRLRGGSIPSVPEHEQDRLLRCAAGILRAGPDCDYVFVGRSLESVFDLVSGALARTSWYDRALLLQLSLRESPAELVEREPERWARRVANNLEKLKAYFAHCQLTPELILNRPRPVMFVDVVFSGKGYGALVELLKSWSESPEVWEQVRERLSFMAVVAEKPPHDRAWLPSDSDWTKEFDPGQVHRMMLDFALWVFLANLQDKTTISHDYRSWGDSRSAKPPLDSWMLNAARGACELYRQGERSRRRLAALLDQPPRPSAAIAELARELRREATHR